MKIDRSEPHSIDHESTPKLLRDYVRATRRSGPDDTAIERLSSRLATAGVLPTPASNPTAAPGSGRRLANHKLAVVAIVVSAGLVLSWRATQTELATETNASAAASSLAPSSLNRSATAQPARPTEPAAVHSAEEPKTAAVSVDDLPAAFPPVASASASVTRAAPRTGASSYGENAAPQPQNAAPQPPTELELVKRAQAALVSSPERALAITREQARAYPSGEFVQEREVIEVEALSRLGRKEEARRRAVAFVLRFPQTPYTPRLEIAVGQPLEAPASSAPPAAAEDPGRSRAIPTP